MRSNKGVLVLVMVTLLQLYAGTAFDLRGSTDSTETKSVALDKKDARENDVIGEDLGGNGKKQKKRSLRSISTDIFEKRSGNSGSSSNSRSSSWSSSRSSSSSSSSSSWSSSRSSSSSSSNGDVCEALSDAAILLNEILYDISFWKKNLPNTTDGCCKCKHQDFRVCVNNTCVCHPKFTEIDGVCVPLLFIGEPCNSTQQCYGDHVICDGDCKACCCEEGFVLTQHGKCVNCSSVDFENYTLPCPGVEVFYSCEDGYVWNGDKCVALLCGNCTTKSDCGGAHQVCVNNNCKCMNGYFTDSCGNCQAKLPVNDSCTCDAECISGTCLCDVCVPAGTHDCCDTVPLCGECTSDSDCTGESQICVNNSCTCNNHTYPDSCGICHPKIIIDDPCIADYQCLSNTCHCDVCVSPDSHNCCDDCDEYIADIVLISDNSGSVNPINYAQQRAFFMTLAQSFKIGPNDTRLGWIDYSTGINIVYGLNDPVFNDNMEVAKEICGQDFTGGWTRTDIALEEAVTIFQSSANRPGVPNYVILSTDGGTSPPGRPFIAGVAADLKAIPDMQVFVIPVGYYVNETELNLIASSPAHILPATFSSLNTLIETILDNICE